MKRSALLVLALFLFATCLYGCNKQDIVGQDIASEDKVINSTGNFSNNIADGGLVALQGDWVYYYSTGHTFGIGEGLYRAKIDGSQKKKIVAGSISNINVVGDWIYYVAAVEDERSKVARVNKYQLFKVRVDGKNYGKILDDSYYVNIIGDKVYYRVYVDEIGYQKNGITDYPGRNEVGHVYSMNLDGSAKTELISKAVDGLIIADDSLVYSTNTGIYQTTPDGKNERELALVENAKFKLVDNNLYYLTWNIKKKESIIHVLNLKNYGAQEIKIKDKAISEFSVSGNDIYFTTSNFLVYRVNTDGTRLEKLPNKGVFNVYAFGDVILAWTGKGFVRLDLQTGANSGPVPLFFDKNPA